MKKQQILAPNALEAAIERATQAYYKECKNRSRIPQQPGPQTEVNTVSVVLKNRDGIIARYNHRSKLISFPLR